MQTYWWQEWGDSRHLCGMLLPLFWPLLFPPYGLSYDFNVLISWICLCGFSNRPNVKIVLGTSICLLSCFINGLLAWPYRQQKERLLLLFDTLDSWNVGLETLYGAHALTGSPFGVSLTPSQQFCLVCHLVVPAMETVHREEESHLFHRTSALDATLV